MHTDLMLIKTSSQSEAVVRSHGSSDMSLVLGRIGAGYVHVADHNQNGTEARLHLQA